MPARSASSLAGFDFHSYNRTYMEHSGANVLNDARDYGVRITEAAVAAGQDYWQAIGVHHLTPEENMGKHNVYAELLDETGQRIRDSALQLEWGWVGQGAHEASPPVTFDKGDNEPAANIPIEGGQRIWVRVAGGLPSDTVVEMHTNHPDELTAGGQIGNSTGHHSYYVVFQHRRKATPVIDDGEPDTRIDQDVDDARYVAGRDAIADGTAMQPGQRFTQVWFVRNTGTSTWGDGYRVVWAGNDNMGAPPSAPIPACGPGQEIPITVSYVAPMQPDTYQSTWQLCNPDGQVFGERFWTLITVKAATVAPDGGLTLPVGADEKMIAVARAWNRHGNVILEHCNRLGIDPGVGIAITLVESSGEPFGPDGRMIIRFENHIFFDEWGRHNAEQFNRHFQFTEDNRASGHLWRPDAAGEWQPCHTGQVREWEVFEFARRLDETAAMRSISMGAGQVMGFNHAALGYATVQAMFQDFQASAENQIAGMFRFIEVNHLVEAVRNRDLKALARRYNGAEEPHAGRMRVYLEAYDAVRTGTAPETPFLRPTAALPAEQDSELPYPGALPIHTPSRDIQKADPKLYEAWRTHIEQGLANNQTMFDQILRGFMNPYWTTVWLYRILFAIGVVSFLAAAVVAYRAGNPASVAVLGGISLISLLTFFFNRPLQALEENLQFITWLGIIYNSYWVRLVYLSDPETVQTDLQAATDDTVAKIQALMDKHTERSGKRPGLR